MNTASSSTRLAHTAAAASSTASVRPPSSSTAAEHPGGEHEGLARRPFGFFASLSR
jgi:hypothetical protein